MVMSENINGVHYSWLRWVLGSVGACVFVSGSVVLGLLDQAQGRHTFGNSGGSIVKVYSF